MCWAAFEQLDWNKNLENKNGKLNADSGIEVTLGYPRAAKTRNVPSQPRAQSHDVCAVFVSKTRHADESEDD